MKQKILFGALAVIIFGSLFVGLKLATALNAESMWLDPEFKTINPTPTQMTFLYDLRINTTYAITAWEAKLLFDPAVIRALDVVWGGYMTPPGDVSNVVQIPGTGESIRLGQTYTSALTSTGEGLLAQINFTFVLPGATEIQFLEAKVWDDALTEYDIVGSSVSGKLNSDMPHPLFAWSCADGRNPLPNHTISEGGDTIEHYDVVTFNASGSYDVQNMPWNGTAFDPDGGYPDIVYYIWDFGDGTGVEGAHPAFEAVTHVYQDYNFDGYLVNLTVRDSEAHEWSTTWRFGGPHDDNTVPMWRDVAVVDFWPSLMPFEVWDNGTGADWWAWWWYDTVDYTIPRTDSYYWNYEADNLLGPGSYARDIGIDILMTFANYGSVPELCKMTLYAIYFQEDLDFAPGPVYTINKDTQLIMIRQITATIGPGAGTGWMWALEAWFMPPSNGYYVLFATVEYEGCMTDDQDPSNNYMAAPNVLDTVYTFDTMDGPTTYAKYRADLDGDGRVGPSDFAIFAVNFGGLRPPPRD
jgi:hypothetical protein